MGHRASSYWYNGPSTSIRQADVPASGGTTAHRPLSGRPTCQLLLVQRPIDLYPAGRRASFCWCIGPPTPHQLCQKLKLLMLEELKTNGGPSRTVLSAPIVYEPSLPALNVWPWLPLTFSDANSTAAYPAR